MSYKAESEGALVKKIVDKGIGVEKAEAYTTGLGVIAQKVIDHYKDEIKKRTDGSGALAQSVQVKLPITVNGFVIIADQYYDFIDEGVNAAPNRPDLTYKRGRVGGSRFSFKNLKVGRNMIKNIRSIVAGDMSNVWATAISIKKHGIEPKNMTEEILTDATLEMIAEDLNQISEGLFTIAFEKFEDSVRKASK